MKLSDMGRGAHLQIRKLGDVWRATLRINTDDNGSGVQTVGCYSTPALAVAGCTQLGLDVLDSWPLEDVPPGVPEALAIANRVGCVGIAADMSGAALDPDAFTDPTIRQLTDTLARATAGAGVSGEPITLIGWRGGGGRGAFGSRRAFSRRYARPMRRTPSRRVPAGPRPHPYPHPYPHAQITPWAYGGYPYGYPYQYPENGDDGAGQDPAAASDADPGSSNPAAAPTPQDTAQQPTPAAPSRGKFHPHADPAPYGGGFDVRDLVRDDIRAAQAAQAQAPTASQDAAVQGMGWNPFHAIKNAVHKAVHFAAHPPTWAQVIFPVLSPKVQQFAAEHVLGKQGDALFDTYRGILNAADDATSPHHSVASELIAKVPQIAQVARVAQAAQAQGKSAVAAVQNLANAAQASGGAPDLNAIATSATQAAQQLDPSALSSAESAIDSVSQLMGYPDPPEPWSPSPYYGAPQAPSWGLPSRRPISFADAYGRIYGPQPRYFRFPKAF